MKVVVIDQTGDQVGGAQVSLESFLANAPVGIEATVIFWQDGSFAERIRRRGIPTMILPISDDLSGSSRERLSLAAITNLPKSIFVLARALQKLKPDVTYTNGIKAHILGSITSRILGIPCVIHHRDVLTGTARLTLLAVASMCSRARIATSSKVAKCFPLSRTTIIDNPVELDHYRQLPDRATARARLGIHDDIPVAGIVGRLNRWKRLDLFLRAVASVNMTQPMIGVIAGEPVFRDAELMAELLTLRSELGLDDLVLFTGWIEDSREIYGAIDINVNVSTNEPFGRTIVEAAASGIPSICFNDSGVSESMVHGSTGIVVRAGDENGIADALRAYASDANQRHLAGEMAYNWSRRFNASLYAERISGVLQAAVIRASAA